MKLLAWTIIAVLTSDAYSVAGQLSVCYNATVIPSTPVFPFFTENELDASLDCFRYSCPAFWYSWIPDVGGSYDFRVESESTIGKIEFEIDQGSKCDSLSFVDSESGYDIVTSTVEVEAGIKYFYQFRLLDEELEDTGILYFSLYPTPVPPANAKCVGAIAVDPLMDEVVIGNVTNAVPGVFPLNLGCGVEQYNRGLWYKIENWTHSELGVLLSIPSKVVEGRCVLSAAISVFTGTDCGKLECVYWSDFFFLSRDCEENILGFLPSVFSTYYIFVHGIVRDTFPLSVSTFSAAPPQNDECRSPIVIPSSPTFPYTTIEVNLAVAKIDPTEADSTCDDPPYGPYFRKVWYEWSPDVSGLYPFGAASSFSFFVDYYGTDFAIFEGDACVVTKQVYCGRLFRYLSLDDSLYITAGKKYTIQITYNERGVGGFYPLALTIGTPIATPPNAACDDAISLNPLSDKIMGDTVNTTRDFERTCVDAESFGEFGVWYKMENMSNDTLSVSVSVCGEEETVDHGISVYQGDNCRNLKCIAGIEGLGYGCEDTGKLFFFASPATTYHFYVSQGPEGRNNKFTLTVDGSPSFLTLINSQTDTAIAILGTSINYRTLPTPRLNILATFGSDITVRSVRMTFNNPNRNFCEKYAPYAVFGDSKGDFFNATIQLGTHLATATPYAQAGCQGPAGISLAKNFTVGPGCGYTFRAYDTSSIWSPYISRDEYDDDDYRSRFSEYCLLLRFSYTSVKVSALPCNVNIQYVPDCGFDVQVVRMTLRNAVTNEVVHDVTDREKPFFLFDTQSVNSTFRYPSFAASNSSIAPGSYILTTFVDGIQHPRLKLFIGNKTACNACGTESCGCPGLFQY